MDEGHKSTEAALSKLEKKISNVYAAAEKEAAKIVTEYFDKLIKRDEEMKALLDGGGITEEQYKNWRLAQLGRGERFTNMQNKLAERMTAANEVAVAYVNDVTPGIYTLNRNYASYAIGLVDDSVDLTIWSEDAVRRMVVKDPDTMPYYPPDRAVKRGIDLAYGRGRIDAAVTSGILQGKSIPQIANSLQESIVNMNRASAIRTARTAITSAQNGGRQAAYEQAEKLGIQLKKLWICTSDARTRDAHREADGQTVDTDKPFTVGGEKLMFPGDSSVSGWNIYNCRCTMGCEVIKSSKKPIEAPKAAETRKVSFVPAESIEEAEIYADRFVEKYKSSITGRVNYKGVDLTEANKINRALTEVHAAYETRYPLRNIIPMNKREKRFSGTDAEAAYQWGQRDLFFNKDYIKSAKAARDHMKLAKDLLEQVLPNVDLVIKQYEGKSGRLATMKVKYITALKRTGRATVTMGDTYGSIIHEMGHYLDDDLFRSEMKKCGFDLAASYDKYAGGISAYATSSTQEYVAESFASYWLEDKDIIDPDLRAIFERMRKK